MKLRDKILRRFGYFSKYEVVRGFKSVAKRSFAAASNSLLLAGWSTAVREVDSDLRAGRLPILARARELEKNNDWLKGVLILNRVNIVGPDGFTFQSRVQNDDGSYDQNAIDKIEKAFYEWAENPEYCTLDKRLDFWRFQLLICDCVERDGEFIARIVTGKYGSKGLVNKFGIALQQLDSTDLDDAYTVDNLPNGNIVKMGIEMDNETREHVAYWIKTRTARQELAGGHSYTRMRIPREEIIFDYDITRVRQSRGISHFAQSLIRLYQLKDWDDSAAANARNSSKNFGVIKRTTAEGQYSGDDSDEERNDAGDLLAQIETGIVDTLDYNEEMQFFDPKYPSEQHGPYTKTQLRAFATSQGMSYATIANDLEGANYSSMRVGTLSERDVFRMRQNLFKKMFLTPIFKQFIIWAIRTGQIDLPYSKLEKFMAHEFIPRSWDWVDPSKDIQAKQLELNLGITTKTAIAAQKGQDYEENLKQLQREKELEEKYGFKTKNGKGTGNTQGKQGETTDPDGASGEGADKQGRSNRPRIVQL